MAAVPIEKRRSSLPSWLRLGIPYRFVRLERSSRIDDPPGHSVAVIVSPDGQEVRIHLPSIGSTRWEYLRRLPSDAISTVIVLHRLAGHEPEARTLATVRTNDPQHYPM
jgi:hypothetical protein